MMSRSTATERASESPPAGEKRRVSGVARITLPRMIPRAAPLPSIAIEPVADAPAVEPGPADRTLDFYAVRAAVLLVLGLLAGGAVVAWLVASYFPGYR
jgi:hypothetical protein